MPTNITDPAKAAELNRQREERRALEQSREAGTAARAAKIAAYNPGAGFSLRQGDVDARRGGGVIGAPGSSPAAWQVGPAVVDRGYYQSQNDTLQNAVTGMPVKRDGLYDPKSRVTMDSFGNHNNWGNAESPDMSQPAQIAAQRAAIQNRLAALTGANQVPVLAASPGPAKNGYVPPDYPELLSNARITAALNPYQYGPVQGKEGLGPRMPVTPTTFRPLIGTRGRVVNNALPQPTTVVYSYPETVPAPHVPDEFDLLANPVPFIGRDFKRGLKKLAKLPGARQALSLTKQSLGRTRKSTTIPSTDERVVTAASRAWKKSKQLTKDSMFSTWK